MSLPLQPHFSHFAWNWGDFEGLLEVFVHNMIQPHDLQWLSDYLHFHCVQCLFMFLLCAQQILLLNLLLLMPTIFLLEKEYLPLLSQKPGLSWFPLLSGLIPFFLFWVLGRVSSLWTFTSLLPGKPHMDVSSWSRTNKFCTHLTFFSSHSVHSIFYWLSSLFSFFSLHFLVRPAACPPANEKVGVLLSSSTQHLFTSLDERDWFLISSQTALASIQVSSSALMTVQLPFKARTELFLPFIHSIGRLMPSHQNPYAIVNCL